MHEPVGLTRRGARVESVQASLSFVLFGTFSNPSFSWPISPLPVGDGGVFRPVDVLVSGSFETGQIIMETDLVCSSLN